MLKIYTTTACVQCEATKRYLSRHNVSFQVIDMSQNLDELEHIRQLGFTQAPVVMTENDSWSGFRLDKLKEIMADREVA